MKNILHNLVLLCLVLLTACNATKQAIKQGNYSMATQLATQKVQKRHQNYKQINLLETAFSRANKKDADQITFLKSQHIPANNEAIYNLYTTIKNRQEPIKSLLPLYNKQQHRSAIFNILNVDAELIDSKDATADYFYNKGKDLLNRKNRFDAREAYAMFEKTKNLNPDFKDVQNLQQQAYSDGQNFVFVKMLNNANVVLPSEFEDNILSLTTTDLKNKWTTYDTRKRDNVVYSHNIIIRLQNIDVSPEKEIQREYTEEDTIKEKELVKDASGKVKKDSLGNDMYKMVSTRITCKVTEVEQHKGANINGVVEFYDRESNQILKKVPVGSTILWQNFSAKANGDKRALTEETKKKIGNRPVPFPNDFFILNGASNTLKPKIKDIIANYFLLVN